jgi:alcohol dehydrogenase class IV
MYFIKPEIVVDSLDVIVETVSKNKLLILTSSSISKSNHIKELFQKYNDEFILIDDVKPENPFSYIEKVYQHLPFYPTTIIAIGGGSVIDLAKAISVSSSFYELKNNFYGKFKELKKQAKVIIFPTTFGSGAEMSYGAILYDDERGLKNGIRGDAIQADKVVLDFSLYCSASKQIKALSGFDCLTHCIETYISTKSDALIKYHAVQALKTVFDNLEKAVSNDIKATEKMAIASMLMGLNLAFSTTCMPHRIQYVIGPQTKTSHAEGLAALYKGWLQLVVKDNNMPFAVLADELGTTGKALKIKIEELKRKLKIDISLSAFGITQKDVSILADRVTGSLQTDPYFFDKDTIKEVIGLSL